MIRLIIADDEMLERAALFHTLNRHLGDRCEICQAENGREVLKLYEERRAQILLLDIEMPGITGIEAAERIREADKECCIIFLTAYDEFAYAKRAITVRAMDYLLKPYSEQELMLAVEEAVCQAERREQVSAGSFAEEPEQEPETVQIDSDEGEMGTLRLNRVKKEILQFIQENYVQDISMKDAARKMNYSEAYFCKLFKQCFRKNFTAYLAEYRMEEAKKLLARPAANIKDVGCAVGYVDSGYFAKVFKRVTGQNPTEYRNDIFRSGQ